MTNSGPARYDLLADLRARYPDSAFLALGQTVFWDEPMKAVLRHLLDNSGLGGRMMLGVHDTDYFAKTHLRSGTHGRFVLMAHNDGTTKNLWSAAGEVSTLFGSETFPSRADFVRLGVPFEKVSRAHPEGRQAFLDSMTEAWGWRGLVYTGSRDLIVSCLPLSEVGDGVLEMMTWGFENALAQIGPQCCQSEAHRIAGTLLTWCRDYRNCHPNRFLTDLYQDLLPRIYTLVLGAPPQDVEVCGTSDLLRFTPATAHLPRFKFVELFLNPATRAIAENAYNTAVSGSNIYTLDKFGPGALPFDIVSARYGRGTLRVTPRVVFVETRQPVAIGLKRPVESLTDLAEVLHARLGDDVTLVGKAVSLVSMLAQEFIFVFNEEGSLYVRRTRRMNDTLIAKGITLDMRPILRMKYSTWDSLAAGSSSLKLPTHLSATFGRQTITTPELASEWQDVIAEQRTLCSSLSAIRSPRDLLAFLHSRNSADGWDDRAAQYADMQAALCRLHGEVEGIQAEVSLTYASLRETRARRLAAQTEMGRHFRTVSAWSDGELHVRAQFQRQLEQLDSDRRELAGRVADLARQRTQVERGPAAVEARRTMRRIENEAELERVRLIRYALLTIEGLLHTNHRPSAWWIPMVDSSGAWFQRIAETVHLYTEPLVS